MSLYKIRSSGEWTYTFPIGDHNPLVHAVGMHFVGAHPLSYWIQIGFEPAVHVDGIDRDICPCFQDITQDDLGWNEHIPLFQNSLESLLMALIGILTTRSRSCVAPGSPHAHSAIAPPIRSSTLAAFSASITTLRKPAMSNGLVVIGYTLSGVQFDLLQQVLTVGFPDECDKPLPCERYR